MLFSWKYLKHKMYVIKADFVNVNRYIFPILAVKLFYYLIFTRLIVNKGQKKYFIGLIGLQGILINVAENINEQSSCKVE